MHGLTVAGHLLMAWSLGLAVTTIFRDVGPGLERDHPPLERKIAGCLVGPMATMSLGMLAVYGTYRVTLLIATPFTVMAWLYTTAWYRNWRADRRRNVGWQTGVIGGVALLVLMTTSGPIDWHGGVVMAAYAASAALLGGLSSLLIRAVFGRDDADAPFSVQAGVVAFGLGISGVAALDALIWVTDGNSRWAPVMGSWLTLAILSPTGLILLGQRLGPGLKVLFWGTALLSALGGQAAIHTVTLYFPGLIPESLL